MQGVKHARCKACKSFLSVSVLHCPNLALFVMPYVLKCPNLYRTKCHKILIHFCDEDVGGLW